MSKPTNCLSKNRDDYETPLWCWQLICKAINDKSKYLWVPFYCNGKASEFLQSLNQPHFHIERDFFSYEPESYDYIIDNPPYSIKEMIFERCIELGKPFALYVPLDTLERKYIARYLNSKIFQILIPNERTHFITNYDVAHTCPPHKTAWFCYGLNLLDGRNIIFEKDLE